MASEDLYPEKHVQNAKCSFSTKYKGTHKGFLFLLAQGAKDQAVHRSVCVSIRVDFVHVLKG